jgi:hypothetical protein
LNFPSGKGNSLLALANRNLLMAQAIEAKITSYLPSKIANKPANICGDKIIW